MKIIHFLTILSLFVITTTGYSQSGKKAKKEKFDCTSLKKMVKNAELHYLDGDYKKAIEILTNGNKINRTINCADTKRDANNLLSKLYLLTNEDEKADKHFRQALKIDPPYRLNPEIEPTDFLYLSEQFKAVPLLSITPEAFLMKTNVFTPADINSVEGVISSNTTTYNDIETDSFRVISGSSNISPRYFGAYTFGGGVRAGLHLNRFLELGVGAGYARKEFEMEKTTVYETNLVLQGYTPTPLNSIPQPTNEELYTNERQQWMLFPVSLRFNLGNRNFSGNVYLGMEFSRLMSARLIEARRGGYDLLLDIEQVTLSDGTIEEFVVEYYDEDITSLRQRNHANLFWGAGFKYRPPNSKKGFLSLDVKYTAGRDHISNWSPVYPDGDNELKQALLFGLGYIDDDFQLNYLQVSVGYTYYLYRIKKARY